MTIYFSFMLTGIILISFIGLRNELARNIRGRAALIVADYNVRELTRWLTKITITDRVIPDNEIRDSLLLWPSDRLPGYHAMIFDLTKWTFAQFYPDLVPVEEELYGYEKTT